MQVQSINEIQTSFKSVFLSTDRENYSDSQLKTFYEIKQSLNTIDKNDPKNRTYAEKYEKDYGLHFFIEPIKNSVILKTVKEQSAINNYQANKEEINIIGEYDEENKFNITDLYKEDKTNAWENMATLGALLVLPLIALGSLLSSESKSEQSLSNKPKKESVDTIINKSKILSADTAKTMKLIVK